MLNTSPPLVPHVLGPAAISAPALRKGSLTSSTGGRGRRLTSPHGTLVDTSKELRRDPQCGSALLRRARALVQLGRHSEALADLTDLISPRHRRTTSEGAAGHEDSEAATSTPRRRVEALYYRGLCHEQLAHMDEAIADFTSVLAEDPHFSRALYGRAVCHNRKGDYAAAIEDYESALRADSGEGGDEVSEWAAEGRLFLLTRTPRSRFAMARQRGEPLSPSSPRPVSSMPRAAVESDAHSANQPQAGVGGSAKPHEDDAAIATMAMAMWSSVDSGLASPELASEGAECLSSSVAPSYNYVQQGMRHRTRGELSEAVAMYTKALALDPGHVGARFNRAFCNEKLGDFAGAIADYAEVVAREPENAFAFYNLGICHDRVENYDAAVRMFTRAIALDAGNAAFFHNRGFSERKRGNYSGAIRDYTQAIGLDARHFKSHFNRGFCFDKLGDHARAVTDYTAALAIQPSSVNAYHNRAVTLEKMGRGEEALHDYTLAIEHDAKHNDGGHAAPPLLHARALALGRLGRHTEAADDLSRVLLLEPDNALALHHRGEAYQATGQRGKAVADYTRAIELTRSNENMGRDATDFIVRALLVGRSFSLRKLGDYSAAARDCTELLMLLSPTEDRNKTLSTRAYCFARLGDYAAAIADYTCVLATAPGNPHALHNRGISFEKSGDPRAAVEDFTALIKLAPHSQLSASAYYSRGTARAELGEVTLAIEDLWYALKLDVPRRGNGSGSDRDDAGDDDDRELVEAQRRAHPAWQAIQQLRGMGVGTQGRR